MELISMSHDKAVDLALLMYVGHTCTECGHKFESLEDLKERDPVCSGKNPLRFACKKCFTDQDKGVTDGK